MSDLISRKAVMKHIEKIRQDALMMDDTRKASIIMNGMHLCEEAVRNQPSAQPEADLVAVVRCKDCKFNSCSPDHGNACCDTFYGMTDQMGYCHYGERRTDE